MKPVGSIYKVILSTVLRSFFELQSRKTLIIKCGINSEKKYTNTNNIRRPGLSIDLQTAIVITYGFVMRYENIN